MCSPLPRRSCTPSSSALVRVSLSVDSGWTYPWICNHSPEDWFAKNLVTTARTIHLSDQKETIHMSSMLREEACTGSIHDIAHIPTQNCLTNCLTKASAKDDRKCWMLIFALIFEPLWNTTPSCLLGAEHSMHTREKEGFFLNTLQISLAQTPQEGPSQVMFVGTQQTREPKELNWMHVSVRARMQRKSRLLPQSHASNFFGQWYRFQWQRWRGWWNNIHHRNKVEESTEEIDEAGVVRQYNFFHLPMRMLCLCLALMNFLLSVVPPSSSFVTLAVSIPHWVVKSDRLSPDEDRLREDYYYEALAYSRHHQLGVQCEDHAAKEGHWGAEKRRNRSKYHENESIDTSDTIAWVIRRRHWNGQSILPSTGTNWRWRWAACDETRWHASTCTWTSCANPKTREDRAGQNFRQTLEKMHRATSEDAYTNAWFGYCRSVFPQSVMKTGPDVDFYNVSTYQCSILFDNMGSLNRKTHVGSCTRIVVASKLSTSTGLPRITDFSVSDSCFSLLPRRCRPSCVSAKLPVTVFFLWS